MEADRSHRGAWFPFAVVRERFEQDICGALAGRRALTVSLAGEGGRGRAESSQAGSNAETSPETSAGAHDRGDELGPRRSNARSGGVSRARQAHVRIAL